MTGMRAHGLDPGHEWPTPATWALNGPWQRRELLLWAPGVAVGPVGLLISWVLARGSDGWATQDGWIAVGSICLAISLAAIAGWTRAGLRNLRTLQRTLVQAARTHLVAATTVPARAAESADRGFVGVAGTTFYHRADCLLVNGKQVQPVQPELDPAADRTACRMCI